MTAHHAMAGRPLTVLVCALGGEGGGVLAEWLYAAAVRAGHAAQATSIPGVAQRTGATTYYLEISREPVPRDAPRPVFGLSPVPGCTDLLVSSELLETLRQAAAGHVSPDRTRVVSSTARALTVAEKMVPADGRVDAAALERTLRATAAATDLVDFESLAREAGTVVSAVMLGAIAGSGVLPIARGVYEDVVRAGGKGVEASLRGVALGCAAMQRAPVPAVAAAVPAAPLAPTELRALGRQRLVDYQDEAYARLYDERLARLAAAGGEPLAEAAQRWLALWMAYDDLVHVARLKLAASRLERVRRETGARDGDVLKVWDHYKPGAAEIAAMLPPRWAARLVAWDRRRVERGEEPWAMPIRLGAHTVLGALALKLLASLKPWRRRGQRHAAEQALIERWLAAMTRAAAEHADLALEIARCGRLIKGYGSTHERGQERLLHVLDHVAFAAPRTAAERAAAVRALREAALADDSGLGFDRALAEHGAVPRAPRAQPVRWYKRKPVSSTPPLSP